MNRRESWVDRQIESWIDRQIEICLEAYIEEVEGFAKVRLLKLMGFTLEDIEKGAGYESRPRIFD